MMLLHGVSRVLTHHDGRTDLPHVGLLSRLHWHVMTLHSHDLHRLLRWKMRPQWFA